MLEIFKAIILGIVEGLTEFLPVSSTGHLIIVNQFVKIGDPTFSESFNFFIQFGAILAVVVYSWKRIVPGVVCDPGARRRLPAGKKFLAAFGGFKTPAENKRVYGIWKKVLIGIIPGLILGLALDHFINDNMPVIVAVMLLLGGIFLIYIESHRRKVRFRTIADVDYKTSFFIGLCQCLAMIPGTSRSAATIIGAMMLGVSRVAAAEFSFYLAIPTMFGASFFKLMKPILTHQLAPTPLQWGALATGFIVSFFVAWVVVAAFMKFVSKHDFKPFGWYRIVLGALVLLLVLVKVIPL